MATGDYHHTALAVARGVGMIPPQGQVVIIQKDSETRQTANTKDAPKSGDSFMPQIPPEQSSPMSSVGAQQTNLPKDAFNPQLPAAVAAAHQQLSKAADKTTKASSQALQGMRSVIFASGVAEANRQGPHRQTRHQTSSLAPHLFGTADSGQDQPLAHDTSPVLLQPPGSSFSRRHVSVSKAEHQGLTFHVDNGSADEDDALQALTAIAQVLLLSPPFTALLASLHCSCCFPSPFLLLPYSIATQCCCCQS